MGGTKFLEEFEESADKILVVGLKQSSVAAIEQFLTKRGYLVTCFSSLDQAARYAATAPCDVLVYDEPNKLRSAIESAKDVEAFPALMRLVIMLLHPVPDSATAAEREDLAGDITILSSDSLGSELVVKLSTKLRLRKLAHDRMRADSELTSQNLQLRSLMNRLRKDLTEARSIQQNILPRTLPVDPRCEFAATYVPLEDVGGDIYDIWTIAEGCYGIFVGDITGHGLAAAFLGAMTKMALYYSSTADPAKLLSKVNEGLSPVIPEGRFVTGIATIYNSETGAITFANAGHPPPLIWRCATKTVERIQIKGLPLGLPHEVGYRVVESKLEVGDTLMLFSDGLNETASMDGVQLGVEGVEKILAEAGPMKSCTDVATGVIAAQERFAGGRLIKDDLTIVLLRRVG